MSYDVGLVADLGAGLVSVGDLDANYTYNCSGMLVEATKVGWPPEGLSLNDLHGWEAYDVAHVLHHALEVMQSDRSKYEAMNPENGWGDLEGWMKFLRTIIEACEKVPEAKFSVS